MKTFRKCISVFLLVVFLAYSGGVGFSLHNCEHCRAVKIYLFQHPDCCAAAEVEHQHHEKLAKNDEKHCCSHQEEEQCPNNTQTSTPEAFTAHCEQCCVSEFMYFKIKSDYVQPQCEKFQLDDFFTTIFSVDLWLKKLELPHFEELNIENLPESPPPLLPGGERFIVYSHQLLFYA